MTMVLHTPNTVDTRPDADTADAVAAEMKRLKSPEQAYPDREVHRTVIGRRISEENRAGDAWIKANLSREQRRALSIEATFGALGGDDFFFEEPPLFDDSWDELLERQARKIVDRRAETGCPTFELWSRPAPKVRRAWPKVSVRATTDDERAEALAKGTEALALLVAGEERNLRVLRPLLRLARAVAIDPKALDDARAAKAWERGLNKLDEHYAAGCEPPDSAEQLSEYAMDAEKLGIVSGREVFMSGGDITDEGEWYPYCRDRVVTQIIEHGRADESVELSDKFNRMFAELAKKHPRIDSYKALRLVLTQIVAEMAAGKSR